MTGGWLGRSGWLILIVVMDWVAVMDLIIVLRLGGGCGSHYCVTY